MAPARACTSQRKEFLTKSYDISICSPSYVQSPEAFNLCPWVLREREIDGLTEPALTGPRKGHMSERHKRNGSDASTEKKPCCGDAAIVPWSTTANSYQGREESSEV